MLRHCRTEMTVASTRERSGNGGLSVCLESESWVRGNRWQWAWGYPDSPCLCKSFQRNATWLWSFLSFQKHTSTAPACVCVCVYQQSGVSLEPWNKRRKHELLLNLVEPTYKKPKCEIHCGVCKTQGGQCLVNLVH